MHIGNRVGNIDSVLALYFNLFLEINFIQAIGDSEVSGTNPITALKCGRAEINFLSVYNLQRHQRPNPLMLWLYGVGG